MLPYSVTRFSVVIPVFNEERSIPALIQRTLLACQATGIPYELVFVDDGSQDQSVALLKQAAYQPQNNILLVVLNRNYGQHAAIMAGFLKCTGGGVITFYAGL